MMSSSRGRYALRVLPDMAENSGGKRLGLSDIAQRQHLSNILAGDEEQINSCIDNHTSARFMRTNKKTPAGSAAREEDRVV